MMGGGAGSQEDMFAKLESMRAVINEVNTQFKDPVRAVPKSLFALVSGKELNGKRDQLTPANC